MTRVLVLYLGSLTVRSIGIAVVAGICTWKMRDASLRHAVWVVVLAAMLLIPAVDYFLPSGWVPGSVLQIATIPKVSVKTVAHQLTSIRIAAVPPPSVSAAPVDPVSRMDWWGAALMLYGAITVTMLIRLILGYGRIWKLRSESRPIRSVVWNEVAVACRWRTPELRVCESVYVPVTVGFFRPVIILPADWQGWTEWKLKAVLAHEMAHVRRADWGIAAVSAVAKCVYWMNPLSWFVERQLSELAEHACDDASITCVRDTTHYAEILLEFAAAAQNGGRFMRRGVAMAQHKMTERIERVLGNPRSGNGGLTFAGWILVMAMAAPAIYAAAALQAEPRLEPSPVSQSKTVAVQAAPRRELPLAGQSNISIPSPAVAQTVNAQNRETELRKYIETLQVASEEAQSANGVAPAVNVESLAAEMQKLYESLRLAKERQAAYVGMVQSSREGQASPPSTSMYVVKSQDSLNIVVWKQPELSMRVTVQPDGRLAIPLVQDLPAAGLTLGQIKAEIEKRLKDYVSDPVVTVILEAK